MPYIHPLFIDLGTRINRRSLPSSFTAERCILEATKTLIDDYITPPGKDFEKEFSVVLNEHFSFIEKCHPLSIPVANVKEWLQNSPYYFIDEAEARNRLKKRIDRYIFRHFETASEDIFDLCKKRQIMTAPPHSVMTILTYGYSSLIKGVITQSCSECPDRYRILVADSMPYFTGLEMVAALKQEIPALSVSYVNITGVHSVIHQATQVMIEVVSMLSNGYAQATSGSAIITLLAKTYKKPVILFCDDYKISQRVATDNLSSLNILASPALIFRSHPSPDLPPVSEFASGQVASQLFASTPQQIAAMGGSRLLPTPIKDILLSDWEGNRKLFVPLVAEMNSDGMDPSGKPSAGPSGKPGKNAGKSGGNASKENVKKSTLSCVIPEYDLIPRTDFDMVVTKWGLFPPTSLAEIFSSLPPEDPDDAR